MVHHAFKQLFFNSLIKLTLLVDDLVCGEVPEDLVRRRVLPDPVLVLDDLPVSEPNLLLALGNLLHLREL